MWKKDRHQGLFLPVLQVGGKGGGAVFPGFVKEGVKYFENC